MGNIYKQYAPPSGVSAYYKPEDGKPVRFRVASEPVVYDSEYEGKVSTKYSWIMYNLDEGIAQVVTLPVTAYRMVAEICGDDDWGDPLTNIYNLKITRRGTSTDTKWSVVPQPSKEELTQDQQNEVKGVSLVKMCEASRGAMNVQWLKDVITNGRSSSQNTQPKRDVVVEDIPDEPINLDDIPFN